MTEADEVKGLIAQVGYVLQSAVADGSTATDLGNQTVNTLHLVLTSMRDSRVSALQEIGHLQDAENQAQLLFNKTVSAEASDVIAQLRKAKERVNNYVNHLANRIKETEKFIALLTHWVDTEMSESGGNIHVAADKLTELYNRY